MTHFENYHIDGDTSIHDELVYIGQTTCGRIEIPLKGSEIKSICTTGDNDMAVETVANSPFICNWLERYSDEMIQNVLAEYGSWSEEELTQRQSNIHRLVWLLAWDIFDSENPQEYLAVDTLQDRQLPHRL